jgi:hypothetical protein
MLGESRKSDVKQRAVSAFESLGMILLCLKHGLERSICMNRDKGGERFHTNQRHKRVWKYTVVKKILKQRASRTENGRRQVY